MGQEPEALGPAGGLPIEGPLHTDASVLGDGRGDGLVKTSVQRPEVRGTDRRVSFHGQLGHSLTDIAVIVHDLGYRHSLNQKVVSVQKRASSDLGARPVFVAQRLGQLIQEQGYPVIDLAFGGGCRELSASQPWLCTV